MDNCVICFNTFTSYKLIRLGCCAEIMICRTCYDKLDHSKGCPCCRTAIPGYEAKMALANRIINEFIVGFTREIPVPAAPPRIPRVQEPRVQEPRVQEPSIYTAGSAPNGATATYTLKKGTFTATREHGRWFYTQGARKIRCTNYSKLSEIQF